MKSKTIKASLNTDQLKSDYIDREPAQKESQPTGLLRQGGEGRQCSLLIFVPRNAISALINDMTRGYGYSHPFGLIHNPEYHNYSIYLSKEDSDHA